MSRSAVLVAAACLVAGCSLSNDALDKSGARAGPVVLHMASTPNSVVDVPVIAEFVRRVAALSDGRLTISVEGSWGRFAPGAEALVVHDVARGRADLGWAGSRVFDTMGVSSFSALSAPMLIDSYPVEAAVLRSPVAGRMLAGLAPTGVTGLGVLGDSLRTPFAVRPELLRTADFHGVGFGTYRSHTQEAAIRAIGAVPVQAYAMFRAHDLETGTIDAFELDPSRWARLGLVRAAPYDLVNAVLWPQMDVLFANPRRLAELSPRDRSWLVEAARETAVRSTGIVAADDGRGIGPACSAGGHLLTASAPQLAAMRLAFTGVYTGLERDVTSRRFLAAIQTIKARTPAGPGPRVPHGCR
jgi:TRAP-type C4-dicarboxylate transport system substrate-binding protein